MLPNKELVYDEIELSKELGHSVIFATKAAARAYARATEDMDPIYYDDAAAQACGYERAVVPSGFHIQYTAMKWATGQQLYVPQGSVHVRQNYEIFREVYHGDRLTTIVTISDKYIKQGRKYVTYRCTIINQRDEIVAINEFTNLLAEEG